MIKEGSYYLIVYEGSPEARNGSVIWIFGHKKWCPSVPRLVYVLHNNHGLTNWLSIVDEHRNLLVDRVRFQQQLALRIHSLFDVLIMDPFKSKCYADPQHKRT